LSQLQINNVEVLHTINWPQTNQTNTAKHPVNTNLQNQVDQSFLDEFCRINTILTDADPILAESNSLLLESSAIGRKPIKITPIQIYPNLWMLFIGKSTITHKTTSAKIALSCLPNQQMLPAEFTPESLLEILEAKPQGLIYRDEMGGFLEANKKREYNAGMNDLLMTLYGCPESYSRKLRTKEFLVKEPCFNILGLTTPSRFKSTVRLEDFTSGYLLRFLCVPIEPPMNPRPRRNLSVNDNAKIQNCKDLWLKLQNFCECLESFTFSEKALERLNEWESEKYEIARSAPDETELSSSKYGRATEHVIKLSAIFETDFAFSRLSKLVLTPELVISLDSVNRAIEFVEKILTLQDTKVTNLLRENKQEESLDKLKKLIEKHAGANGWAKHSKILPSMNTDAREFDRVIDYAMSVEAIEKNIIDKSRCYRIKKNVPDDDVN
jgi:hypothetical protein